LAESVTRMVILAEDSDVTPVQLVSWARSIGGPVQLKETCYGLLVEGERSAVDGVVKALRSRAPGSVFSKERGYGIQDPRKCRSGRNRVISGGPRCGFHQLELESRLLADVGEASESVVGGERASAPKTGKRPSEEEVRAFVRKAMEILA